MKGFIFIFIGFTLFSCKKQNKVYTETIIEDNQINSEFLSTIDEPEKALICGYLYAYGNECTDTSKSIKCEILAQLNVIDECDNLHIDFLNDWFKNDVIMFFKLKECPNLSYDSAIQNEIKKMKLHRNNDTLRISILVYGLNNSQEKSWNSEQTESFLIERNTFKKLY